MNLACAGWEAVMLTVARLPEEYPDRGMAGRGSGAPYQAGVDVLYFPMNWNICAPGTVF